MKQAAWARLPEMRKEFLALQKQLANLVARWTNWRLPCGVNSARIHFITESLIDGREHRAVGPPAKSVLPHRHENPLPLVARQSDSRSSRLVVQGEGLAVFSASSAVKTLGQALRDDRARDGEAWGAELSIRWMHR